MRIELTTYALRAPTNQILLEAGGEKNQYVWPSMPSLIGGDIRLKFSEIVVATEKKSNKRKPGIIFSTPPCEGMPENGGGKLLQGDPAGKRPLTDPQNQLSLFVPKMAEVFKPKVIVSEKEPEISLKILG